MKIVILATTSWNIFNSRLELAKELRNQGHELILLAPEDKFTNKLISKGFNWKHFPVDPRGTNLIFETLSIIFLILFYLREKPDIIHNFTPKGVIYGSIAGHITGIKNIVNTITGLGRIFSDSRFSKLQFLVIFLYKLSLKNTQVVFQNHDNFHYFIEQNITIPNNSEIILGSGVNTEIFKYNPPTVKETPIVLLAARFVAEKGIREFVEASKLLQDMGTHVRMVLVGSPEENQPSSITSQELEFWASNQWIEWWGWFEHMEEIYPRAHIACLPTYYMEGIPKSLIEAASCGLPLIATDLPGCKEIVIEGINGILVPPKNPGSLAAAIEKLVKNDILREQMGRKSRKLVENKFSKKIVMQQYISIYSKFNT